MRGHLINGTLLLAAAWRALRRVRASAPAPGDETGEEAGAGAAEPELERVELGTPLRFACHPGVACFNQCCADMRIALPPYDALRLRQALGLDAAAFFARHTERRQTASGLPLVMLRMDGEGGRCPWVGAAGCGVYLHRPMVCRLFPLGRSAFVDAQGTPQQRLLVQRLPICRGFDEDRPCTPRQWIEEQELAPYLDLGDRHAALVRHVQRTGIALSPRQADEVWLALYDLDRFREIVAVRGLLVRLRVRTAERQAIRRDELALLRFGFTWVEQLLQLPAPAVASRATR